jgi:pSer/pThr/pTyr-binding forkhead associated (FHA) protein
MNLQCPQCNSPISQDGQRFCNRCGNDLRTFYQSRGIQLPESAPEVIDPLGNEIETLEVVPQATTPSAPQASYKETIAIQVPEITLETPQNNSSPNQAAILRVVLPSSDVFDREIKKAETQIGKGPRNDIVIADPAVSTSHAVIKNVNGTYTITDIGSRNGTSINGSKITEPHKLNHGDVIGMGVTKLTFRLSGYSETGVIEMPETTAAIPNMPLPLTQEVLANAVISERLASRADVERLRGADSRGRRVYRALVEDKVVSEEHLRDLMSRIFQIQPINLRDTKVDEAFAAKFSTKLARDAWIFPVSETPWQMTLAVADPTDTAAIDEVKRKTTHQIQVRLATASEITEKIDLHFGPRLVGVLPSGDKLEYPLIKKEVEIGKAPHNHIVLTDQTVSNTHAVVMIRDGGYMIVDLGSRNGTYVNGERLATQPHTLKHGDAIQMGQTVLTFRNPSETPENVTAVLSPEIIEEIRRRAETNLAERQVVDANQVGGAAFVPAGNVVITHMPPADGQAGQHVVSPNVPVVAAGEDADGGKKKKKKEKEGKEKEQERIKAAYIGALGRILAAILSVILTVVLAIYINQSMRGGGTAPPTTPPIDPTTKGKPKIKVATPGAGTPFSDGIYEASGVTQAPNSEGVYFVVDNKPSEIFWLPLDINGKQTEAIKPINFGASIADPEGITYSGSFFYVIGSNSHAEAGERNALARFAFDPATQSLQGQTDVMTNLRDFIIENVPELKAVANLPGNAGGVNIEGIAWDPIHDRLYLGMRSPIVNGKALVVPIKLKDPRGAFSTQNLTIPESPIHLSLNGLGIRDIQYDTRSSEFLIVAGPSGSGGGTDVILYEWNGDTDFSKPESAPREITKLDTVMKPEGVTRAKIGGRDFIFIVGDGSSYMKLDFTE